MHFLAYIAGWIGGSAGLFAAYPFDTVKTIQQNFNHTPRVVIKTLYKHEGIRGFYQGCLGPLFLVGPSNALFFGVYRNCLLLLDEGIVQTELNMTNVFLAGTTAGALQLTIQAPLELGKTIMQSQHECMGSCRNVRFKGTFDALRHEFKHYGIKGIYRGLVPLLYRDIPTGGIYTVTYEYLRTICFKNWNVPRQVKEVIAGGAAGIASCNTVVPFDVIKSRIQADNPEKPKYYGFIHAAKKIYAEEGVTHFLKGYTMLTVRVFIMHGFTFMMYQIIVNE